MPAKSKAIRQPLTNLKPSSALSILANSPGTFAGRKLGVLISDSADHVLLRKLREGIKTAEANMELVALKISGISDDAGTSLSIDQTVNGGPSVLYDAVAIVTSERGGEALANSPAARDFVTDAHTHCKFIGYVSEAMPLIESSGLAELLDEGFVDLGSKNVTEFLARCQELRFWDREG
jgi:catalase